MGVIFPGGYADCYQKLMLAVVNITCAEFTK